jgi:hypothetical protein
MGHDLEPSLCHFSPCQTEMQVDQGSKTYKTLQFAGVSPGADPSSQFAKSSCLRL